MNTGIDEKQQRAAEQRPEGGILKRLVKIGIDPGEVECPGLLAGPGEMRDDIPGSPAARQHHGAHYDRTQQRVLKIRLARELRRRIPGRSDEEEIPGHGDDGKAGKDAEAGTEDDDLRSLMIVLRHLRAER